jgi:hypothetical protein
LLFITGYLGIEYAAKVKKDPKGAVDSFMGKTSIIILLVGLSFACNGQNEIKLTNMDSIGLGLIETEANWKVIGNWNFSEKHIDNIFIQTKDTTVSISDYFTKTPALPIFENEKDPYTGLKGTKANIVLDTNSSLQFLGMKDNAIKSVQDTDSTNDKSIISFLRLRNSPIPILEINSDTTCVKLLGSEVITVDLLLEYKKECLNDSTLVKVNVNPDRNTTNSMGATTCVYYPPIWKDVWTHKSTDNFTDFLNWIEKRKSK